jgi:hypothetical protein
MSVKKLKALNIAVYALHPYALASPFLLRFNILPPVNLAVVWLASKGSRGDRMLTVVPSGTVTFTRQEPGPVTEIQPKPAITISLPAARQPSPLTYKIID